MEFSQKEYLFFLCMSIIGIFCWTPDIIRDWSRNQPTNFINILCVIGCIGAAIFFLFKLGGI